MFVCHLLLKLFGGINRGASFWTPPTFPINVQNVGIMFDGCLDVNSNQKPFWAGSGDFNFGLGVCVEDGNNSSREEKVSNHL
jgi:hypothetical protein